MTKSKLTITTMLGGFVATCTMLMLLNSCSLLLESKVNKRFPKVSPEARKVQNLVASTFALTQIDTASIGMYLPSKKLIESLEKLAKHQRTFAINDADSIVVDTSSIHFIFSNQEIRLEAQAKVFISHHSSLKKLKSFQFQINGFVSPYFVDSADALFTTLHLNPNIDKLKIRKIKFRNWVLNGLSPIAQYIVDDFSKRFIENISGLIPDLQSDLNVSLLLQKKYSELINNSEIIVLHDDTIIINKKLGNKAILIQPEGLTMMSDIRNISRPAINTLRFSNESSQSMLRKIVSKYDVNTLNRAKNTSEQDIRKKDFNELFGQYKSDFSSVWDVAFDSIELLEPSRINTQINQRFITSFINGLLSKNNFSFRLPSQTIPSIEIAKTRIELLEKPKWDCNEIQLNCNLNDCGKVLRNCGSCKWYDVPCQIGWAGCQAWNGVSYAACQASNVAKLGVCTVSYLGEKALCFSKYALLYAAHDLVTVGDIEGIINMSVEGGGQLGSFALSNDLSSFELGTSKLQGNGIFSGNIHYSKDLETTLTSILQCNCFGFYFPIPQGCDFPIPEMKASFDFPATISGNIKKLNNDGNASLSITSNEIPIAVQFKDQTPFQAIFANGAFVIRCQALFFGTALWGIAGNFFRFNDKLQEKYDAVFKGIYTYKLSPKEFHFDLSPITIHISEHAQSIILRPTWNDKSLTYKE